MSVSIFVPEALISAILNRACNAQACSSFDLHDLFQDVQTFFYDHDDQDDGPVQDSDSLNVIKIYHNADCLLETSWKSFTIERASVRVYDATAVAVH